MGSLSLVEIAYVAGLYEGEGTVGSYRRENGTRTLRLKIRMTNIEPLQYTKYIFGSHGFLRGPYLSPNSLGTKPVYEFDVTRFESIQMIIAAIWEWLSSERQTQARRALLDYHQSYDRKMEI